MGKVWIDKALKRSFPIELMISSVAQAVAKQWFSEQSEACHNQTQEEKEEIKQTILNVEHGKMSDWLQSKKDKDCYEALEWATTNFSLNKLEHENWTKAFTTQPNILWKEVVEHMLGLTRINEICDSKPLGEGDQGIVMKCSGKNLCKALEADGEKFKWHKQCEDNKIYAIKMMPHHMGYEEIMQNRHLQKEFEGNEALQDLILIAHATGRKLNHTLFVMPFLDDSADLKKVIDLSNQQVNFRCAGPFSSWSRGHS